MTLNIAVFSSDAGINTKDLLRFQEFYRTGEDCPFRVVYFFADHDCQQYTARNSNFQKYLLKLNPALRKFNIQQELRKRKIEHGALSIQEFYAQFGYRSKTDRQLTNTDKLRIRELYHQQVESLLRNFEERSGIQIDLILLDTYLNIITAPLLQRRILNIHWGDLLQCNQNGDRLYRGFHGVLSSLLNGDRNIYATAHWVNAGVDEGRIIKRSQPIAVDFQRDRQWLEFDFPTEPEAAIRYFSDPLNHAHALELEALYEAYLRLQIDSNLMLSCLQMLVPAPAPAFAGQQALHHLRLAI